MAHPGGPTGGPGHNGGHIGSPGNNDGDTGGGGLMSPSGYTDWRHRMAPAQQPGLLTPRPAPAAAPHAQWLQQFLQGQGMQPQNLPGQYRPIGGASPYGVNLPAFQSQQMPQMQPQAPQAPQSMAPAGWPNLAALPQIPLGQRPPHNPNAIPGGVHGFGSLLGGGHSLGFPRYR